MKTLIILICLLAYLSGRCQTMNSLTIEQAILEIENHTFEIEPKFDKIKQATSFDFCTFQPLEIMNHGFQYKLYYLNYSIVKITKYDSSGSYKKFDILTHQNKDIIYYKTILYDSTGNQSYFKHFGVVKQDIGLNIVIAYHCDLDLYSIINNESIESNESNCCCEGNLASYPTSVFIIDKDFNPFVRLFINNGQLLAFSYCYPGLSFCREDVHTFSPYLRLLSNANIDKIFVSDLINFYLFSPPFYTFLLKHEFSTMGDCLNWQYFRFIQKYRL